jgi:hypothetical protein
VTQLLLTAAFFDTSIIIETTDLPMRPRSWTFQGGLMADFAILYWSDLRLTGTF